MTRCKWASNEWNTPYHDQEWGVPQHDDRVLFEFLILEGAQAGLSWDTILRKRDAYRKAFANFDPKKVAGFDAMRKSRLMKNEGIVRNRLKIDCAVSNARAFLAVQEEFGSFYKYIWEFVGGKPIGLVRIAGGPACAMSCCADPVDMPLGDAPTNRLNSVHVGAGGVQASRPPSAPDEPRTAAPWGTPLR